MPSLYLVFKHVSLLIAISGIYGIATRIIMVPGCDYSQETAQCGVTSDYGVPSTLEQSVNLTYCGPSPFLFEAVQSGFQTNMPTKSTCEFYGCKSNQCLKFTQTCKSGEVTGECVDSSMTVDIPPMAPFLYSAMILLGISLLVMLKLNYPILDSMWKVAGLACACYGFYLLASSITIRDGCDYSDEKKCGSGANGMVNNQDRSTSVILCYEENPGWSPFVSNPKISQPCRDRGCDKVG